VEGAGDQKLMKPACSLPWSNIDVTPEGFIRPCCKITMNDDSFNIHRKEIKDYFNSKFLDQLKQDLMSNKLPEVCSRCAGEEKNYIKSFRQVWNDRFENDLSDYEIDQGIITVDISPSTVCDLKCIMCSSFCSTKWRKEYYDVYGIDNKPSKEFNANIIAILFDHMKNLKYIQIGGGEPMMSVLLPPYDILQYYIDKGTAENIIISINTNANHFPSEELIGLLQKFKRVNIDISLDGFEEKNEYIRFPSNWQITEKNLKLFNELEKVNKKFRVGLGHTLSAYNIYYLPEFFKWTKEFGFKTNPYISRLTTPEHFSIFVYTDSVKQAIITKLLKSKNIECIKWAQVLKDSKSNDQFQEFLKYKNIHDNYRGTNFAKTFPELEELINGF